MFSVSCLDTVIAGIAKKDFDANFREGKTLATCVAKMQNEVLFLI